jgi:hypothetical protein
MSVAEEWLHLVYVIKGMEKGRALEQMLARRRQESVEPGAKLDERTDVDRPGVATEGDRAWGPKHEPDQAAARDVLKGLKKPGRLSDAQSWPGAICQGYAERISAIDEVQENEPGRPRQVLAAPVVPGVVDFDPAEVLPQLSSTIQQLQNKVAGIERTVDHVLSQVIRNQRMMANQLARLEQKSHQSLQTAEQVGQYFNQLGPTALSFGGP